MKRKLQDSDKKENVSSKEKSNKKKRKTPRKQAVRGHKHKTGKVNSVTKKRKKEQQKKRKRKMLLKELAITLSIFVFLMMTIGFFTVSFPKVSGYSMTPTVNEQDRLFVFKQGKIRRFNLVYLKKQPSGEKIIRRVIGLPNEELSYENGHLFINGEEIPERFLSSFFDEETDSPLTADFDLKKELTVDRIPEDSYFVLGDNRAYSTDSRYFGFVKKKEIIGNVKARIFPIHSMCQF